jgi:hypothetical protein
MQHSWGDERISLYIILVGKMKEETTWENKKKME